MDEEFFHCEFLGTEPLRRSILDAPLQVLLVGRHSIGLKVQSRYPALLMLVMQAMGLGGWMYTGINSIGAMEALDDPGCVSLGLRFVRD